MRAVLIILVLLAMAVAGYVTAAKRHWLGTPPGPGEISGAALPPEVIVTRQQVQSEAVQDIAQPGAKHILFGDLHVHTSYSTDAFLTQLPMSSAHGVYPIGDACDFARYCSGLDFWGITDHAESSTPRRWQETKDSVRQCQALAGEVPDLISFIGFEWTQVSPFPWQHYGHKNVLFRDLEDSAVAARPIAAAGNTMRTLRETPEMPIALILTEGANIRPYLDFNAFLAEMSAVPECDPDKPSSQLPDDCFESAVTPGDLVARLEDQGLDPLIIPHGSSWGFYTPPGTTWDKQLAADMRPEAFPIIEVMSGHGNTEEYRSWSPVLPSADGQSGVCPEPSDNFLPSCWRAGEIIADRCAEEGLPVEECEKRSAEARHAYANMGIAGHLAVDGESAADWLDSGQCRDCFLPAFNHQPGTSVQYGLALSNFDDPSKPQRFTWGFIASSDNHRARPGTGYKPVDRAIHTEGSGPVDEKWAKRMLGKPAPPTSQPRFLDRDTLMNMVGFQLTELERQSSFFITGGLAAVHADARSREGVWDAFERREVYGTSGPKILLWFDHVDGDARHPMGSVLSTTEAPSFEVRAIGAFEQKPGCPEFVHAGLDAPRIESLCSGECDHPGDARHPIVRIEVIRIRRQRTADESVEALIEDPWQVHACSGDPAGCTARFSDPDFPNDDHDVLYYARAIQQATPTINADNLRCEYDADGNCIKVNPCFGGYRIAPDDNCTADAEHRAWSSPIYLNRPAS